MKSNSRKVIIDTNLWISFLISKNYSQLDEIIFSRKCILIFSEELLDEFLTVIKRPKFRKFFSQVDTENLIETISLSKDSKADYLITGDNDLLDLKKFESTKIVTMTEFIESKK